jgi:hypothetical protein
VIWTVLPPTAGSVAADGTFRPANAPGPCSVVATDPRDPRAFGQAAVTILAPALPAQLGADFSLDNGALQGSGDGRLENATFVEDVVAPSTSTAEGGRLQVRHGYYPNAVTLGR